MMLEDRPALAWTGTNLEDKAIDQRLLHDRELFS